MFTLSEWNLIKDKIKMDPSVSSNLHFVGKKWHRKWNGKSEQKKRSENAPLCSSVVRLSAPNLRLSVCYCFCKSNDFLIFTNKLWSFCSWSCQFWSITINLRLPRESLCIKSPTPNYEDVITAVTVAAVLWDLSVFTENHSAHTPHTQPYTHVCTHTDTHTNQEQTHIHHRISTHTHTRTHTYAHTQTLTPHT